MILGPLPGIDRAPYGLLQILRAMTESEDWAAQVAWRPQDGYEYWQLVGGWRGQLRLEGWWRRPYRAATTPRTWAAWLQAAARAPRHDADDFAALEPVCAHLDTIVEKLVPMPGLAAAIADGPAWPTRLLRRSNDPYAP